MKKNIFILLLIAVSLFACQKSTDSVLSSKEETLTKSAWVAESAGVKQQLSFNSDKSFKFGAAVSGVFGAYKFNFAVNVSGNWILQEDNVFISNLKIEVLNNGTPVTNLKSANGLSSDVNNVVAGLLKQYNKYIEIDANGNIKLSNDAANKFVWAIDRINDGKLVITIADKKIEFKRA
ncbi:MAG: hypothetical protein IPH58_06700 [Sphingobacteriales bacterium]|jgi:hypothetical protein|nr:hypothetical protein [Sphingobacteriales bacterium]